MLSDYLDHGWTYQEADPEASLQVSQDVSDQSSAKNWEIFNCQVDIFPFFVMEMCDVYFFP